MGNAWATETASNANAEPDKTQDSIKEIACLPRIASVEGLPEELRPYGAVNAMYFSNFSLVNKLYSSDGSDGAAAIESGLWVKDYLAKNGSSSNMSYADACASAEADRVRSRWLFVATCLTRVAFTHSQWRTHLMYLQAYHREILTENPAAIFQAMQTGNLDILRMILTVGCPMLTVEQVHNTVTSWSTEALTILIEWYAGQDYDWKALVEAEIFARPAEEWLADFLDTHPDGKGWVEHSVGNAAMFNVLWT